MIDNSALRIHDTKNPLACCPRCRKAELLGRNLRRPVFRYDKLATAERPSSYDVFHGDQHVARLSRKHSSGPQAYEVRVGWDAEDQELGAPSLRDARALAEEAYTATWREGGLAARGPVADL